MGTKAEIHRSLNPIQHLQTRSHFFQLTIRCVTMTGNDISRMQYKIRFLSFYCLQHLRCHFSGKQGISNQISQLRSSSRQPMECFIMGCFPDKVGITQYGKRIHKNLILNVPAPCDLYRHKTPCRQYHKGPRSEMKWSVALEVGKRQDDF